MKALRWCSGMVLTVRYWWSDGTWAIRRLLLVFTFIPRLKGRTSGTTVGFRLGVTSASSASIAAHITGVYSRQLHVVGGTQRLDQCSSWFVTLQSSPARNPSWRHFVGPSAAAAGSILLSSGNHFILDTTAGSNTIDVIQSCTRRVLHDVIQTSGTSSTASLGKGV